MKTLVVYLVISALTDITSSRKLESFKYKKSTNMKCYSRQNAGKATNIACAIKCKQRDDILCSGYSHNESTCEFCISCPKSVNLQTFVSTVNTLEAMADDFTAQIQKGK